LKAENETGKTRHPSVKLKDVALTAGVSVSTVSRALRNSQLANEETRARIFEAAARLGYKTRQRRRSAGRTILNIVLVLPHRSQSELELFYDPAGFIASVGEGFGDIKRNFIVVLEGETQRIFQNKKLGDIDGCIFAYCTPAPNLRGVLLKNRVPWILINRVLKGANYITIDNARSMQLLVETVAKIRSPFRPVFLTHALVPEVSLARKEGFLRAVERLGLRRSDYDVVEVPALGDVDAGLVSLILRRKMTVVFCLNDVFAVRFFEAAVTSGVQVPNQLGIVGSDDSPIRKLLTTSIDTMTFSHANFGKEAAVWLAWAITERRVKPMQRLVVGRFVSGHTLI
jgi:LacI family transcriptional regulator